MRLIMKSINKRRVMTFLLRDIILYRIVSFSLFFRELDYINCSRVWWQKKMFFCEKCNVKMYQFHISSSGGFKKISILI